jgi:glycosyltransferase involved in cell wall biosynthesis
MKLVLFANVNDLNIENATTSSNIFTLTLVKKLKEYFDDIFIISNQVFNNSQMKEDNIRIIEIKDLSNSFLTCQGLKAYYKNIEYIVHKYSLISSETVFLMFGYNYKIGQLFIKLKNKFDVKLFAYIFDTHKYAISLLPYYKKVILDKYHKYGIKIVNNFDGVVLFNKLAYEDMKLSIPFLISRIGIDNEIVSNINCNKDREFGNLFHVVYTGSLEYYNGIELMINAFKDINRNDVVLDIYGDGILRGVVEEAANEYFNINYYGIVSRDEIYRIHNNANLLLNLRDMTSPVCKYAFPSKLIEYMATGTPVLSTKVIDDQKFENAIFILNDYSSKCVVSMINHIIENPENLNIISKNQIEYIKKYFTWFNIPSEMYRFFKETRRDNRNGKFKNSK